MLQNLAKGCTRVNVHLMKRGEAVHSDREGGSVRIDVDRDTAVASMRRALSCVRLAACVTKVARQQMTHSTDLTMLRIPNSPDHNPYAQERVWSSELLAVHSLAGGQGTDTDTDTDTDFLHLHIPMVWLEWGVHRVPCKMFPCVTQAHDVRHCIRRDIHVSESVTLCFETYMNHNKQPMYEVRMEIRCGEGMDAPTVAVEVERALHGLGFCT
ncbi:MAG: hypothetical protein WDW38_006477 [Sanguina aurantia]